MSLRVLFLSLFLSQCLLSCCTTRQTTSSWVPPDGTDGQTGASQRGRHNPPPADPDESSAVPDGTGEVDARDGASSLTAVSNKEYEPIVLDMLKSAQSSIRVVHFECNDDDVIDAIVAELVAARKRGVDVKVLLENEVEDNGPRITELTAAGIQAWIDTPTKYTHAKLFVVDGRKVLFGSTNMSYMSIQNNNETDLYIESLTVGAYFAAYADALYAAPDKAPDLAPVSDESIGLVRTLHDDEYFDVVRPMLQQAKGRILLLVYGFHINPDYPDSDVEKLADELVAAKGRGVDVRVILEYSDYNTSLNDMNEATAKKLLAGGVPVRWDPADTISHAKLLLVDDQTVVGSNNWGHGGLHLYHEVGGVTRNVEAVEYFTNYYEKIWGESKPLED